MVKGAGMLREKYWRWKRSVAYGILLAVVFTVLVPSTVFAKLVTAGPQDALAGASTIVVGTVTARHYSEDERSVTIQIDQVVKGDTEKQQLSWKVPKPRMYGWLDFDFPETGNQVLLLLNGNDQEGFALAWDLNCVAVVDEGRVTALYHGTTIGLNQASWEPEQYAAAYDAYYQAHKPANVIKPSTSGPADPKPSPWAWLWEHLRRLLPFRHP